jgi:hypothetical protein
MDTERKSVITVKRRKIGDERQPDPGFQEADIFFSPVDVLMKDGVLVGKVGYSDERDNDTYRTNLTELVAKSSKGKFSLKTVSIDEADRLGLVTKPVAIGIPPLGTDQ